MNKIIVFPGSADGVFFLNEIDHINKHFDEVIVITYPGDKERFEYLSKEKGFRYFIVDTNWRKIFTLIFIKWLFSKDTMKEIRGNISLSVKGIKKIGYIFLYGLFYTDSKEFIDNELNKSKNDDIYLYSFWLTRGAYTISMYNVEKQNNIKKITSRAHGYDLYEYRNILNYLPFRGFVNNNLDDIYFISKNGLDYHKEKYGIVSSGREVSRLGTFNNGNYIKNIVNKEKICIASCSSISHVKRIDLIIDVLSKIEVPFKWIHIGDGKLITEMKEYANEKLKKEDFEFLGRVNNEDILSTYINYDVDFFINMSDSEGVPVSIMEALSIGIPTIARDVGGVSEIINDKVGLLIDNIKDKNLLYTVVNEELNLRFNNILMYEMKVKNSIETWEKRYDADKNYNLFFDSLKS